MKPFPLTPYGFSKKKRPKKRTSLISNRTSGRVYALLLFSLCISPHSHVMGHGGDSESHGAGECTIRLFVKNSYKIDPFDGLANRIIHERDLLLDDVQSAINRSKLIFLGPIHSDLLEAAGTLDSIQSQLQPAEQRRVVKEWAEFVRACESAAPTQYPEYFSGYSMFEFCGFRDEWHSIRADSEYTAAFFSPNPLFGLLGILGFIGDTVTFIPSVVIASGGDFRRWQARHTCLKRAQHFIRLASIYERKYAGSKQDSKQHLAE